MKSPVEASPGMKSDASESTGSKPPSGLLKKIYEARCILDGLSTPEPEDLSRIDLSSDQFTEQERGLVKDLAAIFQRTRGNSSLAAALSRDGRFELRESEDGWTLLLDLEPPLADGEYITAHQITEELRSRGIRLGVDMKAIIAAETSHRKGEVVQDIPIVHGQLPGEGKPGYIELSCRTAPDAPPVLYNGLDKAPADSAQRICAAGDVVARRIPCVVGKSGYNARGDTLFASTPSDADFLPGENVTRSGDNLVATVDGTIEISGNTIGVRRVLIIDRDLSGEQTKIDFDGDVQIEGAVRDMAEVKATGNITVNGSVGSAKIESTNGAVFLNHGIAGQDNGFVKAAGDIHARFAERATLQSGGDIVLEVGAIHARMTAVGSFDATRGRGQVLGGLVIAGHRISAKQFGNASSVQTILMAGYNAEQLERRAELEMKYAEIKGRYQRVKEAADQIKRMVGDIARLSPDNQTVYAQLLQVVILSGRELGVLEKDKQALNAAADHEVPGEIRATSLLQTGCEISLGNATTRVSKAQRSCRLIRQDGEIVTRSL